MSFGISAWDAFCVWRDDALSKGVLPINVTFIDSDAEKYSLNYRQFEEFKDECSDFLYKVYQVRGDTKMHSVNLCTCGKSAKRYGFTEYYDTENKGQQGAWLVMYKTEVQEIGHYGRGYSGVIYKRTKKDVVSDIKKTTEENNILELKLSFLKENFPSLYNIYLINKDL